MNKLKKCFFSLILFDQKSLLSLTIITLSFLVVMHGATANAKDFAPGLIPNNNITIPNNSKHEEIAKKLPKEIIDKGFLKVASENYPPAVIVSKENAKPLGWEPAIAKQLGKVLGIDFDIHIVKFDTIISGLIAGRYDIAMGEIAITKRRLEKVVFVSEAGTGDTYLLRKDSNLKLVESGLMSNKAPDACGHTIAVLSATTELRGLKAMNKKCLAHKKDEIEIKVYSDQGSVNLAVASGRADAALGTIGTISLLVAKHKNQFKNEGIVKIPGSFLDGIVIAPTSYAKQLGTAIRDALNVLIDNGTMSAIFKKWNLGVGMIEESKLYLSPGDFTD